MIKPLFFLISKIMKGLFISTILYGLTINLLWIRKEFWYQSPINILIKLNYMKVWGDKCWKIHFQVTIVVFLLMDKLVQENHTLWLDMVKIEVLCQWYVKNCLLKLKKNKHRINHSKSPFPCLKYITKKYKIY